MAKYKPYNYSQRVMIPVSLEDQLIPGTLEFAIHTLVEGRMSTSIFEDRYNNDETGRWAYYPKVLLKVIWRAEENYDSYFSSLPKRQLQASAIHFNLRTNKGFFKPITASGFSTICL